MAKTLQDYLGSQATTENGNLTVSISELYSFIFPEATSPYQSGGGGADEVVAILIAGIHARNKPVTDENSFDVTPSTQALVATESFQERTFVTRDDVSQIQHEFIFNIYTADYKVFPIDRIV